MGLQGPKRGRYWVRARSGIATTEPGVRFGAKSQQMEPVFLEPRADMVSGQKFVRLGCISRTHITQISSLGSKDASVGKEQVGSWNTRGEGTPVCLLPTMGLAMCWALNTRVSLTPPGSPVRWALLSITHRKEPELWGVMTSRCAAERKREACGLSSYDGLGHCADSLSSSLIPHNPGCGD